MWPCRLPCMLRQHNQSPALFAVHSSTLAQAFHSNSWPTPCFVQAQKLEDLRSKLLAVAPGKAERDPDLATGAADQALLQEQLSLQQRELASLARYVTWLGPAALKLLMPVLQLWLPAASGMQYSATPVRQSIMHSC